MNTRKCIGFSVNMLVLVISSYFRFVQLEVIHCLLKKTPIHRLSIVGCTHGSSTSDSKNGTNALPPAYAPPSFAPSSGPHPGSGIVNRRNHANPVIEAAHVCARDEQEMQQTLMNLQYQYGIYNSDIEPEHETDWPCNCPIHQYQSAKWRRYGVQEQWSRAVMYPGEKAYDDSATNNWGRRGITAFPRNPYIRPARGPTSTYSQ